MTLRNADAVCSAPGPGFYRTLLCPIRWPQIRLSVTTQIRLRGLHRDRKTEAELVLIRHEFLMVSRFT